MCRWLAYIGNAVLLHELLFEFKHSIVRQSLKATEGAEPTNGDGFGLGWYGTGRDDPLLYRSVEPAWHDRNLREFTKGLESALVFAHVRAASPTVGNVQQTNCHPFRHKNWLWMHNGVVRGFQQIKRQLMLRIDPDLFGCIEGSTDSETFFYLAITFGLFEDPPTAVAKAVGYITKLAKEAGVEFPVQMTVCTTDGKRIWAFRYSSEGISRTLYYSTDIESLLTMYPPEKFPDFAKRLETFSETSRFVVSEPLGDVPGVWNKVPESTCVFVDGPNITLTDFAPIDDECS